MGVVMNDFDKLSNSYPAPINPTNERKHTRKITTTAL